jgi:hypothetical protein
MTKTTVVRALVALVIVLLIAAASIIIIRSNADGAATSETPGPFRIEVASHHRVHGWANIGPQSTNSEEPSFLATHRRVW